MATRSAVLAGVCCVGLSGCGVESDTVHETVSNLQEAGFPANDIQVVDGTVYVGQDVVVSLLASRELLDEPSDAPELYRTSNLVSTSIQTIYVRPVRPLAATVVAQLHEAIANYNDLGLTFDFVFAPNPCELDPNCPPRPPYANIDLVINPVLPAGASATSLFPSGGNPGARIELGPGVAQLAPNILKHLLTHELGHTIGLRHADYFNRAISCGGTSVNEGSGSVGAIHIAGTPTGASPGGSIMNTCIPANTPGEFTSTDITALNFLY
ncbi:zinc-dependent metalloprotease [Myxococcus sp. K15C18031901]|uniref:M57 family metalloprotease n=1 Tax=Myxococcus dinghuensis TaxID=2906761 RepID=UPI0020A83866|nr:M57 family metalloprotease [Myxococcus dinghuensis]MCP3097879.1 zinc-dependent metalloprotease [Myxococcus dinghuensis]